MRRTVINATVYIKIPMDRETDDDILELDSYAINSLSSEKLLRNKDENVESSLLIDQQNQISAYLWLPR